MENQIIAEYRDEKPIFQKLASKLEILTRELLAENGIRVHQINSRVKEERSLCNKINAKIEKYKILDDITDIVGIRIITYLDSDVDIVSEVIKKEFKIDFNNSIDKRKLENDVFGYRSLHYVASFNDNRCKLTEFKRIKGKKFEIQIRSILQHAWAEIEHDLGYKTRISIPDNFIRGFNRLSALLETADLEFDRLKRDLTLYESTLPKLIENSPNDIEINQASIASYAQNSEINQEALSIMVDLLGCSVTNNPIGELLVRLKFLNIKSIGELNNIAVQRKDQFLRFISDVNENPPIICDEINICTPLYYLCDYLALERGVFDEMNKTLKLEEYDFEKEERYQERKAFRRING